MLSPPHYMKDIHGIKKKKRNKKTNRTQLNTLAQTNTIYEPPCLVQLSLLSPHILWSAINKSLSIGYLFIA